MIKNFVTEIGGIEIWGLISIALFFTVFLGALIWAACQKPSFLNRMSSLPLSDGDAPATKGVAHE
jgi:adenosylcobinamide amidohydrolase